MRPDPHVGEKTEKGTGRQHERIEMKWIEWEEHDVEVEVFVKSKMFVHIYMQISEFVFQSKPNAK